MEFAVIAPTTLLPKYAAGRKVQFCLAHLCNNPGYLEWYRSQVALGDTVILDNGAYEEELMPFDELAQVASELQPTILILPDVLGDAKMTKYLHSAFRSYWHANAANEQIATGESYTPTFMSVLQGADVWELVEQYKNTPDGEWIGFPRRMAELSGDSRYWVASKLKQIGLWDPNRKHHALGMVDGSTQELAQLAREDFHSCDSSHPVWRAIDERGHFNVGWDGKLKWEQQQKIDKNLADIASACKGGK